MISLLISILPNALYILVLKLLDSFALARFRLILRNMLIGLICCTLTFVIVYPRCLGMPVAIGGFSLVPLIEEILKGYIPARLTIQRKFRFLSQCLIYGAAVGSGFSLLENLLYFYFNPSMILGTSIVRGLGCAIMHMGCTALFTTLLLLLRYRFGSLLAIIISITPTVAIHFLYNLIMGNEQIGTTTSLFVVVAIFIGIFIILFAFGEKRIRNWMDFNINNDISTLSAIHTGDFSSTKAGEYLMDIKKQFRDDVFTDMLSYLQLFLELRISKQSEMLLNQTGFSNEVSEEKHKERNLKKSQMKVLADRIGKTGMIVLAPLLNDNV